MFALFSPSLTVIEARLVLAARLFGDFNPLHVDDAHATKSRPSMEGFPRSAAGKVLKRETREPYWKASARKI